MELLLSIRPISPKLGIAVETPYRVQDHMGGRAGYKTNSGRVR